MVGYEVAVTIRSMVKADTISSMKRICTAIMQEGSVIKNIQNLGDTRLAYKISAHNERFETGRYVMSASGFCEACG
jgi:small subunit ribosomal protein S6